MNAGLVSALFVAAGVLATGLFVAAWRRDMVGALAGLPVMFGGAGMVFVGVARYAARAAAAGQSPLSPQIIVSVSGPPLGQEAAVLIAVAAFGLVALGAGMLSRATRTHGATGQEAPR